LRHDDRLRFHFRILDEVRRRTALVSAGYIRSLWDRDVHLRVTRRLGPVSRGAKPAFWEEKKMDVKRRDVLKGAAATTAAAAVGSAAIIAPTPSYAQQLDAAKK